MRSELWQPTLP